MLPGTVCFQLKFTTCILPDEKLHKFTVAVGDSFNLSESFEPGKFKSCAHVLKLFQRGETRYIPCEVPVVGRYISIYMKQMTICY